MGSEKLWPKVREGGMAASELAKAQAAASNAATHPDAMENPALRHVRGRRLLGSTVTDFRRFLDNDRINAYYHPRLRGTWAPVADQALSTGLHTPANGGFAHTAGPRLGGGGGGFGADGATGGAGAGAGAGADEAARPGTAPAASPGGAGYNASHDAARAQTAGGALPVVRGSAGRDGADGGMAGAGTSGQQAVEAARRQLKVRGHVGATEGAC